MLQPATFITQACNATTKFLEGERDLIAELRCFQHPPDTESLSAPAGAYPPWPVVLTLKQASRSCLGRRQTSRSSETSPWTSRPGTSQWLGTSHLCGAPARRSSEACRRTGLGSCGERLHKKKAHSWGQPPPFLPRIQPRRAESEQKHCSETVVKKGHHHSTPKKEWQRQDQRDAKAVRE